MSSVQPVEQIHKPSAFRYIRPILYVGVFFISAFLFFANAHSASATAYFGKTGVSPHLTTSWGTTTGGGGSNPGAFTTAGDTFTIESGITMTASAAWPLGSAAATGTTSTLTINTGGTLTMGANLLTLASTNFVNNGTFTAGTGGVTISGTGTTIAIGGFTTTGPFIFSKTAGTATLTAGGSTTGNVSVAAFTMSGSGAIFAIGANTLTINGATTNTAGTFSVASGTVIYASTAQVIPVIHNNLTLQGTTHTFPTGTTTINGIYSIENGTSAITYTGTLTYGTTATLQYNSGSSARTVTNTTHEWPTPFVATGGVKVLSTGILTVGAARVFNSSVPLNIGSGATVAMGGNLLTASDTLACAGTISGTAGISVTGNSAAMSSSGTCTISNTGTTTISGTTGPAFTGNWTWSGAAAILSISGGGTSAVTNAGTISFAGTAAGSFTIGGKLTNNGTVTFTGSGANATLGGLGTFTNGNNATLNYTGQTPTISTFTLSGTSNTVNYNRGGAQTCFVTAYVNLTFSVSGAKTCALTAVANVTGNMQISGTASWTLSSANPTINGNLTLDSGTFLQPTNSDNLAVLGDLIVNGCISLITGCANIASGTGNITVNGNVSGTGTINLSGNTFEQRVASAKTFGDNTGTSTGWAFKNLTFSNSATDTPLTITTQTGGTGSITVSGLLSIGKSGDDNTGTPSPTTLDAGNRTWILSNATGSTTPLVLFSGPVGVFTASTSTVQYSGTTETVTATTYNNLTLGGTSTYTLPAADITLRGNLVVTTGATVTKSTSNKIIFASGGGSQTITGNAINSNLGILQVSANSTATTLTMAGSITASDLIVDASQTFATSTFTATLSGDLTPSGTVSGAGSITVNGGDVNGAGIITMSSSGTFTVDGTGTFGGSNSDWTFYNLAFGDGSGVATTSMGTGSGTFIINGAMSVATAQILNAGSKTWNIFGTGPTVSGTFTPSSSTVNFKSITAASIPAVTYNNVAFIPASGSPTYTIGGGLATPAFVQGASNGTGGSTALVATLTTTTTTTGNTIMGAVRYDSTATLNTVTSSCITGNLTIVDTYTGVNGLKESSFYGLVSSSISSCTVTSNFSIAAGAYMGVHEVSGIASSTPVDGHIYQYQIDPGPATDAVSSSAITTTQGGDYIFGIVFDDSQNNPVFTAGTGYTPRVTVLATGGFKSEDRVQSAAGAISATFTLNSSGPSPLTMIMAFKAAAAVGSFVANGTVTVGNGTNAVTVNGGTGSVTSTGNFSIAASAAFTSTTGTLTLGGSFTNTPATTTGFAHNNGTVAFTTTSTATITGTTTFYNVNVTGISGAKTLQFVAGTTYTFAGPANSVTITGTGGNLITITSTTTAVWLAHFNNTQNTITYVNLVHSGCSSSAIVSLDVNSTNDATATINDSACWQFPAAGIIVSGTSNCLCSSTVKVAVNGSVSGQTTTVSSGTWSISTVAVSTGQIVVVWLDGVADAAESTAVAKYDGSGDITGMILNTNILSVGSADNQSLTLTNLDTYDCAGDEDVMYRVNSNVLEVEGLTTCAGSVSNSYTNETLQIESGDTLTVGGSESVTTMDLTVNGTLSGTGNVTASGGDVINDGTITFTAGTFLVDGAGNFGGATGWTFNNLTFGDGSGTTTTTATGAGAITVTGGQTIAANQTLNAGSKTWNLQGTGSNLAVDLWETLDFTTLDATNLAANDNTSSGSWSVTNAGAKLSTSVTGEQAMSSTVNGASDAGGTRGLAYDPSSASVAGFVKYQLATPANTASFGFWFKPNDLSNPRSFTEHDLVEIGGVGGDGSYVKFIDGVGTNSVALYNTGAHSYSSLIAIPAGSWYWITVKVDRNQAASYRMRVYNTSGAQVGSEVTVGPIDEPLNSLTLGSLIGGDATTTGNFYIDDLVVDWTNAVYPLGGTVGAQPFTATGPFSAATSTINFQGNADLTIPALTYNNLSFSPTISTSGKAYTFAAGTTIGGNLDINPTAGSALALTVNLAGTTTVTGSVTIQRTTSATSNLSTGTNNLSAASINIATGGTLTQGSSTVTLSGTGTPLTVTGTYTPSGTATVQYTGATATVTATSFVNLTLGGTGTYTLPASTLTVTGNMVVSTSATATTAAGAVNISGDLTATGTLSGSGAGTITVNGAVAGTGTINISGNSFVQSVTVDKNFGTTSGANNWSFNSLTFTGTSDIITIQAGTGSITVAGTLTISGSTTLDAGSGSRTIILSSTGTPFVITGTFTANTSTVQYTGATANVTITSSTNAFKNLTLGGTGVYTIQVGSTNIKGNLVITSGASLGTLGATRIIVFAGSGTQTLTDNNSTKTDLGYIQLNGTTLNLASSAKVTSWNTVAGTFSLNGTNTLTITGSGAAGSRPFINGGTFTPSTGTVDYEGSSATDVETTSVTYTNLNVGTTSDVATGVTYTMNGSGTVTGLLSVGNSGSTNADTLALGSTTLTLSGTGTPLTLAGSSKGLVTATSATVNYTNTTGGQTINLAATTYSNLGVGTASDSNAANTFTLGGATTVTGVLTVGHASSTNSDVLDGSSATLTLSGTGVPLTLTSKGTFTGSTSTVNYTDTTGGNSITVAAASFNNLGLGTATDTNTADTFTLGGNTTVAGTLTVGVATSTNSDVLNASTFTLTLSGNGASNTPLTLTSKGTFTASTSTVQYTGTTVNVTAATYKNLTLGGTGTYSLPSSDITLRGNLVVTSGSTVTKSASNKIIFAIGGASSQTVTDSTASKQDLGIVQVTANSGVTTLNMGSDIKLTSLTIDSSQVFSVNGSNTLTITGNGTVLTTTGGTFTPSTGTVAFVSGATTGTTVPALTYNNLTVNKASNTFTSSSGTLAIGGNLAVTAGSFDLDANDPTATITGTTTIDGTLIASSANPLTIKGDWTNNGTFTHSSGTVVVDFSSTAAQGSISITGTATPQTFNNLTSTTSTAGKNLKFKSASTFVFAGTVTLNGSASNPLRISSTTSTSQWLATLNGTAVVSYLTIIDSGCTSSSPFTSAANADSIFDLGNNGTCWFFISRGGGTAVGGGGNGGSSGGGSGSSGGGSGGSSGGDGSGSGGGVLPQGFTGTNGALLTAYDSNWNILGGGTNAFVINSNGIVSGNTGDTMARWTAGSFNDNQYSQITIISTSTGYIGVGVRLQSGAQSGYGLYCNATDSKIIVWTSGTPSTLYTGSACTGNDVIKIEISGTNITFKKNNNTITSVTDATYSTGRPGLVGNGNSATRGDDFYADSIASQGGGGGGGGGSP